MEEKNLSKRKKKSKGIKYTNSNVIVSTNEFMQIFMIKTNNYSSPRFSPKEIIFSAEKDIDKKASVTLIWNLIKIIKNPKAVEFILSHGREAFKIDKIKEQVKKISTFSREEIIMYIILFNHYVENIDRLDNEGKIVITIKDIHCKYRNKTLKMYSKIDQETLETYMCAIRLLGMKQVCIETESCKDKIPYIRKNAIMPVNCKLLEYDELRDGNGNFRGIRYSLGSFGNLLIVSKRMTSKFPVELLEKPYKQIGQVFIGLYLSKILYINSRKRKCKNGITLSVPTILSKIVFYDRNGNNTNQTMIERLNIKGKQNFSLVRTFRNNLIEVLDLYKKHGYIHDYEIDNITVATYKLKSTKVKIFVN